MPILFRTLLIIISLVPVAFAQEPDLIRQIGIGPVQAVFALIVFIALFILIFAKPVWGLVGVICYYPFISGSTALGMQQILAGLLIVLFLILWLQRRLVWRTIGKAAEDYNHVKTIFLLFWIYVVVNSVLSGLRGTPPIDIVRDLAPWSGLALFLFMEAFLRKEKDLILVRNVQISVMAIVSIYTLQWFIPNLSGIIGFISIKSSFLGIMAILLVGASGIVINVLPKWLAWLFCAVSSTFFILTPTRTHFIVAVLAVTAMMAFSARKRRGLLLAIMAGVSAVGIYSVINKYLEPVLVAKETKLESTLLAGGDPSVKSRLDEIYHAWDLFVSSPLTGIGAGHRYRLWRHWVGTYHGPGIIENNFLHSDLMNFLAKLGLIGTALYLWFYYKITSMAWKIWKFGQQEKVKVQGLICFILLCAAFLAGQSTPVIQARLDCLFLGFVMGYTYCAYRLIKSNGRDTLISVKPYSFKYS